MYIHSFSQGMLTDQVGKSIQMVLMVFDQLALHEGENCLLPPNKRY